MKLCLLVSLLCCNLFAASHETLLCYARNPTRVAEERKVLLADIFYGKVEVSEEIFQKLHCKDRYDLAYFFHEMRDLQAAMWWYRAVLEDESCPRYLKLATVTNLGVLHQEIGAQKLAMFFYNFAAQQGCPLARVNRARLFFFGDGSSERRECLVRAIVAGRKRAAEQKKYAESIQRGSVQRAIKKVGTPTRKSVRIAMQT